MAMGPMWFAYRTVATGQSANQGLKALQQAGMGVRRETWLRMVGEARVHYASIAAEFGSPNNRPPNRAEMSIVSETLQRGFIQYVDVWVRSKTTGDIYRRPQAFRTDTLLSRDSATSIVHQRYMDAVERSKVSPAQWGTQPDELVIGAIYRGTLAFEPDA